MILEICAATLDDIHAAEEGGADRIELNMALEVGGLTPTLSLLREARAAFTGEILCMVRPRSGGFVYSDTEKTIMHQDASALLDAGCDGIVFGSLTQSHQLDLDFVRSMKRTCGDAVCVFHRAIDLVIDWQTTLTQLMDEGMERILTSGMMPTAIEGKERLAEFVDFTRDSTLQIVAGSGVSIDNLIELAQSTGCVQFHGTFSKKLPGQIEGPVALGTERRTQACLVREAKRRLAKLSF